MEIKGISREALQLIEHTIRRYFPDCRILAFGSRLDATPAKYSDLDLCLDNGSPLSLEKWALVEEELANSDLPIKVDLSDYHRLSNEFRQLIDTTAKPMTS